MCTLGGCSHQDEGPRMGDMAPARAVKGGVIVQILPDVASLTPASPRLPIKYFSGLWEGVGGRGHPALGGDTEACFSSFRQEAPPTHNSQGKYQEGED